MTLENTMTRSAACIIGDKLQSTHRYVCMVYKICWSPENPHAFVHSVKRLGRLPNITVPLQEGHSPYAVSLFGPKRGFVALPAAQKGMP